MSHIFKSSLDLHYEGRTYVTVFEQTLGRTIPLTVQAKIAADLDSGGSRLAVVDAFFPHSGSIKDVAKAYEIVEHLISKQAPKGLADRGMILHGHGSADGLYWLTKMTAYGTAFRLFLEAPATMSDSAFHEAIKSVIGRELQANRDMRRFVKGGLLGRGRIPEGPTRPRDAKPDTLFELRPEAWRYGGGA